MLVVNKQELIKNFRLAYTKFNVEIYIIPDKDIKNIIEKLNFRITNNEVLYGTRLQVVSNCNLRIYDRVLIEHPDHIEAMYIIKPEKNCQVTIVDNNHGINFRRSARADEAILIFAQLCRFRRIVYRRKLPNQLVKGLGFKINKLLLSIPEASILECRFIAKDFDTIPVKEIENIQLNIGKIFVDVKKGKIFPIMKWNSYYVVIVNALLVEIFLKTLVQTIKLLTWSCKDYLERDYLAIITPMD